MEKSQLNKFLTQVLLKMQIIHLSASFGLGFVLNNITCISIEKTDNIVLSVFLMWRVVDSAEENLPLWPIFREGKSEAVASPQTPVLKKASINETLLYGASDGTRHEPNYAELAQMCLHETEIISDIEKWCA